MKACSPTQKYITHKILCSLPQDSKSSESSHWNARKLQAIFPCHFERISIISKYITRHKENSVVVQMLMLGIDEIFWIVRMMNPPFSPSSLNWIKLNRSYLLVSFDWEIPDICQGFAFGCVKILLVVHMIIKVYHFSINLKADTKLPIVNHTYCQSMRQWIRPFTRFFSSVRMSANVIPYLLFHFMTYSFIPPKHVTRTACQSSVLHGILANVITDIFSCRIFIFS